MLRYYAKQGDKVEKGFIELGTGVTVSEVKIKKSPHAFVVRTEGRDYVMYPESRAQEDCNSWQEKIAQALKQAGGSPARNPPAANGERKESKEAPLYPNSLKNSGSEGEKSGEERPMTPKEDKMGESAPASKSTPQNNTIVSRLNMSKDIVNFLKGGADNQMCEFWNLWFNTVNNQLNEDAECDIQFNFSYSADFNKLFWNSGEFICNIINFFKNYFFPFT